MSIIRTLMISCVTTGMILLSAGTSAAAPAYPGANGVPFQALQSQIDALAAYSQAALDQINQDLQDQQGQINDATQRIADLEAQQDNIEQQLAGLETDVANNTDDIGDLNTDVASNADAIDDLEAELAQVNADIAALTIEVNKKQDRITGSCPSGTSIRQVNNNGTVNCEMDHDSQIITSYKTRSNVSIAPNNKTSLNSPVCTSGYRATGGGFAQSSFDIQVTDSYPRNHVQWGGWGWNRGSSSQTLYIDVVCTIVTPVDSNRAP